MRQEIVDILGRELRAYVPDIAPNGFYRDKRPALLILPGGAYCYRAMHEGEPIALRFAAEGVPSFVLDYTCTAEAPRAFPHALREGFAAIRWIRTHAEEYGIDPENIAVCGFSAGGHLCASLGTLWNKPEAEEHAFFAPGTARECRPDKLVLCYPVIRLEPPCNEMSAVSLLGEEITDELRRAYSLQNRVDAETPPAFLWSTADDSAVPILGALQFAEALSANGVPFEVHIWPKGVHGLSLANHPVEPFPYGQPHAVAKWAKAAVRFLYEERA